MGGGRCSALILSSNPRKIKTCTRTDKVQRRKDAQYKLHKQVCICSFTLSFQTTLTFALIIFLRTPFDSSLEANHISKKVNFEV